jgi:protein FAM50
MADNIQRALQLEKERAIMKEIFKEKRDSLRKESKISISTDKFIKQTDDLSGKLARDTVGLVRLEQFQKIREDIEISDAAGSAAEREAERERQRKRLLAAQARLSFAEDLEDDQEPPDAPQNDLSSKRKRMGANPSVKSYFEEADLQAQTDAIVDASLQQSQAEAAARAERAKTISIRLTLSFYDGADHRFFVDFKLGDTIREMLQKCRLEYGPLRGILLENLMFVKENLILPAELSVFELQEMGALKDGGRGPHHSHPLFAFASQKRDQKTVHEPGSQVIFSEEDMIETDSSRNAKIFTKTWYERNKHLIPAKYWLPFDSQKHCKA